jgi:hypothetical protein
MRLGELSPIDQSCRTKPLTFAESLDISAGAKISMRVRLEVKTPAKANVVFLYRVNQFDSTASQGTCGIASG